MGVNNRARRAEKRRKRARAHSCGSGGPGAHAYRDSPFGYASQERGIAAELLMAAIAQVEFDPRTAADYAARLTEPGCPVAAKVMGSVVEELLTNWVRVVLRQGWTPADLAEISRRRLTAHHVPLLVALLAREADRYPADRVAPAWRDELTALGPPEHADLTAAPGLELAIGLSAVLGVLPDITTILPAPGASTGPLRQASAPDAKRLATVRALLAKAESTQYDEEAEALSAKAQELISRYALDRLVEEAEQVGPRHGRADVPVVARRLWIDAPYVAAKAMLINAVASANRCRAVVVEEFGFSTVVGEPRDLDGVELLATSLLVQADTAMLRCGRSADRHGTSRTKSFRRSFLIAYASRIGERLRAATADATVQTGRSTQLVPVLARHAEQVTQTFNEMFPHTTSRPTSITNGHGWAAGRAAADLALLDTRGGLTEAAS